MFLCNKLINAGFDRAHSTSEIMSRCIKTIPILRFDVHDGRETLLILPCTGENQQYYENVRNEFAQDALRTLTTLCDCTLRENVGRLDIAARMWLIRPYSCSRPWASLTSPALVCYIFMFFLFRVTVLGYPQLILTFSCLLQYRICDKIIQSDTIQRLSTLRQRHCRSYSSKRKAAGPTTPTGRARLMLLYFSLALCHNTLLLRKRCYWLINNCAACFLICSRQHGRSG